MMQQTNARRNGALPNTLKAYQVNKIYKNKYPNMGLQQHVSSDNAGQSDLHQNQYSLTSYGMEANKFYVHSEKGGGNISGFKNVSSKKNN